MTKDADENANSQGSLADNKTAPLHALKIYGQDDRGGKVRGSFTGPDVSNEDIEADGWLRLEEDDGGLVFGGFKTSKRLYTVVVP